MPEATWLTFIPDALETIKVQEPERLYFAADVMELLQVERRQAQKVIDAAGAEKVGKAHGVHRDNLRLYLEREGGEALAREQARRKRLALKLREEQFQRIKYPRGNVKVQIETGKPIVGVLVKGPLPRGTTDVVEELGFRSLPKGIEFGSGEVRVRFETAQEGFALLFELAKAIAADGLEELAERTGVPVDMAGKAVGV